MKAILVHDGGERLAWQDTTPCPAPGPGQVRVRVRATAVNRADLLQRIGRYPPPPGASEILGLEAAGEIESVGPGVDGWQVGDRVCLLLEGGGYAQYLVADASMLLPIPDSLSFEEAAALPEAVYTAWVNLVTEGGLEDGQTVWILAAASGIGTMAVQLARLLGARVVGTASEAKLDRVRELGAHTVLDRRRPDLDDALTAALDGGAHVIFDPVGGDATGARLRHLRTRGTLVLIGLLAGVRAEVPLGLLLTRRLRLVGSVLRSRSRAEKVELTRAIRERVWPAVAEGRVRPVIESVLGIEQAEDAHALLQANTTRGKVVLRVPHADA